VRALKLAAALGTALVAHLFLLALAPASTRLIDPFLLALVYAALPGRPGWAAIAGAILGLAHDALSGGLYGLHGFAGTAVAYVMARAARLVDLHHKPYYVALFFACAVVLEQLVLQGLLLFLVQRAVPLELADLALRAAIAAPLGVLLVAACSRFGEWSRGMLRRRRAEILLE
jgi:rod shape-determining protein MreD